MLTSYFADMHIHIGRDMYNNPVKITASNKLTLTNILMEASRRKGIDLIGIIDSHVPTVQMEILHLIEKGQAIELDEGGIRFEHVTLILGCELEVYDNACQGPIHVLAYFPSIKRISAFTEWLKHRMKNITLSSQRYYGTAKQLQNKVKELEGIFIPAHIFTPFKSLYGKGVKQSLTEILDPKQIDGVELGLSSDSMMADQIKELHAYTYLSNSDAHSLNKIGREYQAVLLKEPSFIEFCRALHHVNGRKIIANYGMNPQLGKYYTTVCANCLQTTSKERSTCVTCGAQKIIKGVFDRIQELSTAGKSLSSHRPPYKYQVPLEYIPTLGPKTFQKLLDHFGTEMNVIHHVPFPQLKKVVSEKLADAIINMREGKQSIQAGGGGTYGTILS
ncbi:endonuclease Q family protein [Virgibacillus sp. W0430]|uniref:endonuclease Q family protein n=1 Tax=Virgibacillus sp. W0430 TaxID=3391580 RepID=UPI003F44F9F1